MDASEDGVVEPPPAGGDPTSFADALDCDLAFSPMTNLMPILRHRLLSGGGPVEIRAAWVSVPDLGVRADGQRYTFVRADDDSRVVRFEATDGVFAADIVLDADGICSTIPPWRSRPHLPPDSPDHTGRRRRPPPMMPWPASDPQAARVALRAGDGRGRLLDRLTPRAQERRSRR